MVYIDVDNPVAMAPVNAQCMSLKYLTELRKRDATLIHGVSKCLNSIIPSPAIPSHIRPTLDDNSKCSYCRTPLNASKKAAGDHVISLVRNKKPILTNLHTITIPACNECNGSKSNRGIKAYFKNKGLNQTNAITEVLDFMNENGKVYLLPDAIWNKIVHLIDYGGLVPLEEFIKSIQFDQFVEAKEYSIEELFAYDKPRSLTKLKKNALIELAMGYGLDTTEFENRAFTKAMIIEVIKSVEDEA